MKCIFILCFQTLSLNTVYKLCPRTVSIDFCRQCLLELVGRRLYAKMSENENILWNDRSIVSVFINLVKEHPSLYDYKNINYKSKPKRVRDLRIITEKMRPLLPNISVEACKNKLNGLRSQYRRELRKLEQSIATGDEVYKSKLWCYEMLCFLGKENDGGQLAIMHREEDEDVNDRSMVSSCWGCDVVQFFV